MSQKSIRDLRDAVYLRLVRTFLPSRYQKLAILHTASRYDMSAEPAEQFFTELYLRFIRQDIVDIFGSGKITILDAGCGQGRISLPLMKEGHRVTGIDLSPEAVDAARRNRESQGISGDFRVLDITASPGEFPDNFFDCVICTEMIYMVEDPGEVIRTFSRIVRPGGLVIVSFRPKMYYLLLSVQNGSWGDLETISHTKGGRINGIWLNWFTRDEIIDILTAAGITVKRMCSIGKFSGIEGDPQAGFCNPEKVHSSTWNRLLDLEILHAHDNVENGRYLYSSGIVVKK
jgi:2-polyprenyl-3-methyl-5-hydroxy-6-metoxy-1,4-benzoquinol methylase